MSLSPEIIIQKYNQIQICKKKMAVSFCHMADLISTAPANLKAEKVYDYICGNGYLREIMEQLNENNGITMFISKKNCSRNYEGMYYLSLSFVFYDRNGKVFEDSDYLSYMETAKGLIHRKTHRGLHTLNYRFYKARDVKDFSPLFKAEEEKVREAVFSCCEHIIKLSDSLSILTRLVKYEAVPEKLRERVIELQEFVD